MIKPHLILEEESFLTRIPPGQGSRLGCASLPWFCHLVDKDLSALPPSVSLAISWLMAGFSALEEPALLHGGEAWEGSCFGRDYWASAPAITCQAEGLLLGTF